MAKRIAIIGSTGSIGRQALDVIRSHPDQFQVEVLTAGNNVNLLIEQAKEFLPNAVAIANEHHWGKLSEGLKHLPVKVFSGSEAVADLSGFDTVDMSLVAVVGFAGLLPVLKAIKNNKHIALANKEALVVAGELVTRLAWEHKVSILPVDSEHSAIFQCLAGERLNKAERLVLTGSGGPFRGLSRKELLHVTPLQALQHPTWQMGDKITIDSASLMNKGLEMIEAHWLFSIPPEKIEVVIHPQSIIHSMVEFCDGSVKAQMGIPDMRLPIQYALGYPFRLLSDFKRFDFSRYTELTFSPPDTKNFRNLALAYEAITRGGNCPCVLNAANEVAVEAFLAEKISFDAMPDLISKCIEKISYIANPSLDDYQLIDSETRHLAVSLL